MLPIIRSEFGVTRTSCDCPACVAYCKHVPGFLIPSDLEHMIPDSADPLTWAEANLMASLGAIVFLGDGTRKRVPMLVMASRTDLSCIKLQGDRCTIHETAPFGCAFFGCTATQEEELSRKGVLSVATALNQEGSLYRKLLLHLIEKDLISLPPEVKRTFMQAYLIVKGIVP